MRPLASDRTTAASVEPLDAARAAAALSSFAPVRRPSPVAPAWGAALVGPAISIVLAALVAGCASGPSPSRHGGQVVVLGPDLELSRVDDELWIHVSDDPTARWGSVPANGLLVGRGDASALVDTGWNQGQTERLLEFAAHSMNAPVRHFIATHGHPDRVGGALALAGKGIIVHAQTQTAHALEELNLGLQILPFESEATVMLGDRKLELLYPGPGHTRDNVVVYLPDERVLFAGCLAKSRRATDLGNREDAVLEAWPRALLRLLARFGVPGEDAPAASITERVDLVVPGHGPPGHLDLIHHTLGLLEQELAPANRGTKTPAELN